MVLVSLRDREAEGFSACNKMNPGPAAEISTTASLRAWLGFSMMCLGMFMAILDIQVVATSLPTIQRALNIAPDEMSWIQTAYLIAEIISIPLTGFLIRAATMRWLFTVATVVFILASIGCALSSTFKVLIAFRILQGFTGGTSIPTVFSAVFLLFPTRLQTVAATIAGVIAVLGPTIGPVVGGWITDSYSWPWLFLINVPAGVIAASVGFLTLPKHPPSLDHFRRLDLVSFALGAAALVALELAIKDAPKQGWASPTTIALIALFLTSATLFVLRTRRSESPLVDLGSFATRNFSIGCLLSFILGMGLYGSVYLIPIFLAYARSHNAFDIGTTMLVTGLSQLVFAPVAAGLTRRVDERLLTVLGFVVFGVGLALSAHQTIATDFDEMFWPQVVRGSAIMFCLLPPTEFALGDLAPEAIPDASGLFNLMRNLGGAIGIAIIDTIIFSHSPQYAQTLVNELTSGNLDVARSIGVSKDLLSEALVDPDKRAIVASLVQKSAFVRATNDAWAFLAMVTLVATVSIPLVRRQSKN
jgi:MFS transporter, DHA2 family, multidrug resistance protein